MTGDVAVQQVGDGDTVGLGGALIALPTAVSGTPWTEWLIGVGLLLAGAAAGVLVHALLFRALRRTAPSEGATPLSHVLLRRARGASLLFFPAAGARISLRLSVLPEGVTAVLGQIVAVLMIAAVTWGLIQVLEASEDVVRRRYDVSRSDNLRARRVHTQVGVFVRAAQIIVAVIGAAVALMTFEQVRVIGTSLLASAGLAGLIIGLAARPAVSNLIAGVQIALTQPIRLDDVVIMNGEWGRIEEITASYVVVRVWDQRRLIVPLTEVIEKPFQNWTRTTAELLGTVFLHADYTVDIDALRAELARFLEGHPKWDGRVQQIVVTDATPTTLQLRALVSSANAGDSWDLRCEIREHLVSFLQRTQPGCLPRARADVALADRETDGDMRRNALS